MVWGMTKMFGGGMEEREWLLRGDVQSYHRGPNSLLRLPGMKTEPLAGKEFGEGEARCTVYTKHMG